MHILTEIARKALRRGGELGIFGKMRAVGRIMVEQRLLTPEEAVSAVRNFLVRMNEDRRKSGL